MLATPDFRDCVGPRHIPFRLAKINGLLFGNLVPFDLKGLAANVNGGVVIGIRPGIKGAEKAPGVVGRQVVPPLKTSRCNSEKTSWFL